MRLPKKTWKFQHAKKLIQKRNTLQQQLCSFYKVLFYINSFLSVFFSLSLYLLCIFKILQGCYGCFLVYLGQDKTNRHPFNSPYLVSDTQKVGEVRRKRESWDDA